MANTEMSARVKRSERMPIDIKTAFEKKVEEFDTLTDACEFFGFSRVTLNNLLTKGTGKPSTIGLIKEKLNESTAA
jgi:hypothetical protein